jgi:superoxide dismutase, Cu-Zn family
MNKIAKLWTFALVGTFMLIGCDVQPDEEAISRVMPVTRPPESFEDKPGEVNPRSPVDPVADDRANAIRQLNEQSIATNAEERVVAKPDMGRTVAANSTVVEVDDPAATQPATQFSQLSQAGARQKPGQAHASDQADIELVKHAVVVLQSVGDNRADGTIYFDMTEQGLHVHGKVSGLSSGKHGFHVHQYGDLSDTEEGQSAGGHFDPHGKPHGARDAEERHIGDFGNIEAGEDGVANVDFTDPVATLSGEYSILGRSIVVHTGEDKFTQPTGDAGPRAAFGVIGVRNTEQGKP